MKEQPIPTNLHNSKAPRIAQVSIRARVVFEEGPLSPVVFIYGSGRRHLEANPSPFLDNTPSPMLEEQEVYNYSKSSHYEVHMGK